MSGTAEILQAKHIGLAFARTFIFIIDTVWQTARLRASAAVAASTAEQAAKQALTGIGITQGTVYECLQLHAGLLSDLFHLGK